MVVDYLSTINSNGSGLNVAQIAESLTAAEVEPKRAQISARKEAIELSISEMGKLRAGLEGLRRSLSADNAGLAFDVASSAGAVNVEIADVNTLQNRSAMVEVLTLARGQVLEFQGFSSADQVLGEGILTIDFGSWAAGPTFSSSGRSSVTVRLSGAETGLDDLATKLSAIGGVTAQIVDKGDGEFSLAVMTDSGSNSALCITAVSGLADFDTRDGSNQIVAAANAELRVDGIAVSRSTNQINDLLPGLALTLNTTTSDPVKVVANEDVELAKAELRAFIDALNETGALLREASKRGVNGAVSGPLVSDPTVAAIKRNFLALTTTPLEGFGDTPLYLSNLGVRTERDGSLSFDAEVFQAAFSQDPAQYRAIFRSFNQTSEKGVTVALSSFASPPAGAFIFSYSGNGEATLDGDPLLAREVNGVNEFYRLTGDFAGVTLRVTEPAPLNGYVFFGKSLIDRVRDFLDASLTTGGDLLLRTNRFEQDIHDQEVLLTDLAVSETRINERYMVKFGAMETIITQLKNTGDYLSSMLDAWNNARD